MSRRLDAPGACAALGAASIVVVGCGSPELQNYAHYTSTQQVEDAAAQGPPDAAIMDAAAPVDSWVNNGPVGLHVVVSVDGGPDAAPQIQDALGKVVALHGVNRSGSEYACVHDQGIFDGPADGPSVQAIASWPHVNAVRVPLNESCWLGINGAPAQYSGAAYKQAIVAYVSVLHQYGLVPILDLHWVGPGTSLATDRIGTVRFNQLPMPDLDHAKTFWTDVATTFAGDTGVVFDPFNEPFPGSNTDSNAAWQCWRDGCASSMPLPDGGTTPYQAVGLQDLVTAIRAVGATNLILLGGVQFSNALTQWLAFEPVDTQTPNNIAAAWHAYSFNQCSQQSCWDAAPAGVAAKVPLVATEIGERDCLGGFVTPLMQWLDGNANGYLAWSWNAFGACSAGQPYSLVVDYGSGTPNGPYAQAIHDHIAALP